MASTAWVRSTVPILAAVLFGACSGEGDLAGLAPAPRPEATRQSRPVHIVAVGDILLADAAENLLDRFGYDYPFQHLKGIVAGHDLLLGNLEGPITDHTEAVSSEKAAIYKTRPQAATALKEFGFDLFNLANNHILDYGLPGLLDTRSALDAAGIGHFGAGLNLEEATRGKVVEVAGLRIGFLGFMERYSAYVSEYPFYAAADRPGVPLAEPATLRSAIERMRREVDTLVVSFHWGRNYSDVRDNQIRLGRLAVDLGADIVIGHNAHNLQGLEIYRQVPILYSLGNFTFGTEGRFEQMGDLLWGHGWVADIRIERGRAARVDLIPIAINNKVVGFQPRVADPALLPDILKLVNERFATPMGAIGDRARWTHQP